MKKPRPHHHRPPKPHAQPPRVPAPVKDKPTHWAEIADWYDQLVGEDGSEYHREVVLPGIFRMLNLPQQNQKSEIQNQKSLTILDLACGQGVLSRKLAAAGCTVTALDAAAPLIDAAARRNSGDKLPITYGVADATKLLDDAGTPAASLKAASFDAITLILAIQNITPLSPVWQACKTLLKPGGSLIIVMMHPAFRVPKQSDWIWQEEIDGGTQSRTIRQYLTSSKVEIQTHPGLAAHGKDSSSVPHFHRPLQAYINTLGNAGLLIDHIEEWPSHKSSQPGPRKAALDRARKEIPMFLALRAKRV